jgi:hypothetical protein
MDYLGASGSEGIPHNNLSGMRFVAARSDPGVVWEGERLRRFN